MSSIAQRILDAIAAGPLTDRELTASLGLDRVQSVNPVARRLEAAGRLQRIQQAGGSIVNALPGVVVEPRPVARSTSPIVTTEDDVKRAVGDVLESLGFQVETAWGRERGIDIDARHSDGRRYMIEAKGEVRSDQQQGSYFLQALGELLQRMNDPDAVYALALPYNRRYVGLVMRLPSLAWARIGLRVFWVLRDDAGSFDVIETDQPPERRDPKHQGPIGPIPEDEMY